MSHPTSSAVDALQAHFKGGLQPPSSRPSQAQLDTDDGSMSQTRQLDQNPGHSHHARISRTSPPPSYPDPLILADDGYHGQLPPNQPIHVENDTTGRAAIAQNNLISILPKPISITKGQRVFSTAIWNDQVNFALKRKAEDDFIDPRLSRAPGSEYTGVPGMGMSPNYTSPASSGVPVAVHHSLPGQGFNTDHLSQGTDAVGIHRPIRALGLEVDSDIVDSATDALLERQLDLRDGSDEEGDLEDRREGPSRYHDEDDEQQRGRRGRGRGRGGRGRGARRGPRKAAEPTGDVKYRINMASNAYMDGRLDEAIEWVEDAIRINAETYRAWTLLASLLEEKGDPKGSFTARLFSCHLQPKHVEGWLHCAEIGIELRDELPQDAAHFLEQVSTCYSAALRADINNRPARHGRAAIAAERGQIRTAAKDYLYLLEHGEYDVHALRSYAEMTMILASAGKRNLYTPSSAIDWYYRAFTHFRSNGMDDRHPLEWQDINYFAGLLSYVEHTKDALYELKSLARWLLGRSDESFWDDWQDDDREWDIDSARRIGLENFQYGKYPESSYGSGLPLDMRTKLAVYRLKLGDVGEAQRHISHIDPNGPDGTEVLSNEPHLLAEIGCALYESELRTMALCFFEPLLNVPDVLDSAALLAAGRCYLDAGDKRQAEECFGAAIDADESNDEASIDARYELAKMYEAAREEQEAYILVNEALRLQQAHDEAEGENEEEDMGEYEGSDDDARNRPGASATRKARSKNQRPPPAAEAKDAQTQQGWA